MSPSRKLSEAQAEQLTTLADAGVPRGLIAQEFGLSESGVQLYLGREGHKTPRQQVERLENAWNIVTDEGRRQPGYSTQEKLATIVTRGVFGPIIRETLKETNLEPYLAALTSRSADDGFAYRMLGKQTMPFARDVAAWSVEQSRGELDTPRTLSKRASEHIYGVVLTGELTLGPEYAAMIADALDALTEREASIVKSLHGFQTEPRTVEDLAPWFGLPEKRIREIGNKAQRKIRYRLVHDPSWKQRSPLPIDVYRPEHLTDRL